MTCFKMKLMKLTIMKGSQRFGHDVGNCDIVQTLEYNSIICRCIQIYLGDPSKYRSRKIDYKDKQSISMMCNLMNQTVYIHCPFVANLALPNDEKIAMLSYHTVKQQLSNTQDMPSSCVLHIGKKGKCMKGNIEQVGINVNSLVKDLKVNKRYPLLMENAAGQTNELGASIEELRHLFESFDKGKVGLCVDTQHSFASGLSKFQTHEQVCKFMDSMESVGKIQLFHLNDSVNEYGSGIDRHKALTKGHMWYKNQEGLYSLIDYCFDKNIDMISETDDPIADIRLIRDYVNIYNDKQ